jgi:hypothetical protein
MNKDKIQLLVDIILDPNAADHEKDDAALDLAEFNDDHALNALIKASQNPSKTDLFALDNYGETIGKIWVKRNFFDKEIYNSLHSDAKWGIYCILQYRKPKWIEQYQLREDKFKD